MLQIHTILRRAFRDAVRWGELGANIADLADPPRKASPDLVTWNADQVRGFLERADAEAL